MLSTATNFLLFNWLFSGFLFINNFQFFSHFSSPTTDTLVMAHVRHRLMHGWHEPWMCCNGKPLTSNLTFKSVFLWVRMMLENWLERQTCYAKYREARQTWVLSSFAKNDNEKRLLWAVLRNSFKVSRLMLQEVINLLNSEIVLITISHFCWRRFVSEIRVNQMIWNVFLENEK